mmetsp:Transcript_1172/g.2533  ORF Transcript_1172/g.2533 Transcript_1172/m.2533 type:complete len:255 (+) Transcript_1172:1957-2721(+)
MLARLPAIRLNLAGWGFAAQRRPKTNGARSASSSSPASRTKELFAPQRVFENCGSVAAWVSCRTDLTSLSASDRWAGSASKSPLAINPASNTAPNKEHVGIGDLSNAWRILSPWPPGWAKGARTGASHASHKSFATNSWHFARVANTASCDKPPRRRKPARMVSNFSASRATITFSAMRASSKANSSRSTRPRSWAMTSAWMSRARASSEPPRAPDNNLQIATRDSDCWLQCPLSMPPPRSSRKPSMSKSRTAG